MSMKDCPNCGLIVDERHRYCASCGFDWAIDRVDPKFASRIRIPATARAPVIRWAIYAIAVFVIVRFLASWITR